MLGHLTIHIPRRDSLQGRIVTSVGATLLLILGIFVVIALWALHQGTEEAFQARVAQARENATHVDDVVAYVADVMQTSASALTMQPDGLSTGQLLMLAGLRRRIGPAVSLFLILTDGTVLWSDCSEPCGAEALYPLQADRILDPATQRKEVSEQTIGASAMIRVDVPLFDQADRFVAILVSEINPRHPSLVMFPAGDVQDVVDSALIAADGRLIAGANSLRARFPGVEQRAAQEHARLLVEADGTVRAGYRVHASVPGRTMPDHVVAFAPLTSIPTWIVTVEQPVDQALALPLQIQVYLAVVCGVTLAVVMALAFLDVRRITAPIQQLTAAAQRLAAGCLEEPVRGAGRDELGELARTFELMRVQLRVAMERDRNVAILEERERIAGEMHDGLGQVLGYVIMKTMAVDRLIESGDIAEARTQVEQLGSAARAAYADVRESILALRTTLSPDRNILAALREYLAGFERQNGINVELIGPDQATDRWIEPVAEVQLLRIVQEALANVRKHAAAQQVSVRLTTDADWLQVEIVDDGMGFDPPANLADDPSHFGLQIMQERAEGVGGTFTIERNTGGGTAVRVKMPRCQRGSVDATVAHSARR